VVIEGCLDDPVLFFNITSCRTDDSHGIDIVAQKGTELWIIEVKGETNGGRSAVVSNFHYGLGQILTRIFHISSDIHYALAVPNTINYSHMVRKTLKSQPALHALNLSLILVQSKHQLIFMDR
jgi:hypothetical protein